MSPCEATTREGVGTDSIDLADPELLEQLHETFLYCFKSHLRLHICPRWPCESNDWSPSPTRHLRRTRRMTCNSLERSSTGFKKGKVDLSGFCRT